MTRNKLSGENGHTSCEVWSLPCAYKTKQMPESTLLRDRIESLRTKSGTNKSIAGLSRSKHRLGEAGPTAGEA